MRCLPCAGAGAATIAGLPSGLPCALRCILISTPAMPAAISRRRRTRAMKTIRVRRDLMLWSRRVIQRAAQGEHIQRCRRRGLDVLENSSHCGTLDGALDGYEPPVRHGDDAAPRLRSTPHAHATRAFLILLLKMSLLALDGQSAGGLMLPEQTARLSCLAPSTLRRPASEDVYRCHVALSSLHQPAVRPRSNLGAAGAGGGFTAGAPGPGRLRGCRMHWRAPLLPTPRRWRVCWRTAGAGAHGHRFSTRRRQKH